MLELLRTDSLGAGPSCMRMCRALGVGGNCKCEVNQATRTRLEWPCPTCRLSQTLKGLPKVRMLARHMARRCRQLNVDSIGI